MGTQIWNPCDLIFKLTLILFLKSQVLCIPFVQNILLNELKIVLCHTNSI